MKALEENSKGEGVVKFGKEERGMKEIFGEEFQFLGIEKREKAMFLNNQLLLTVPLFLILNKLQGSINSEIVGLCILIEHTHLSEVLVNSETLSKGTNSNLFSLVKSGITSMLDNSKLLSN